MSDLLDRAAAALSKALGDVTLDPRKLRQTDCIRLVNSTPLGAVLTERRLRDHRAAAGFRIGSDKHVDLFRYAAWLAWERHKPIPLVAPQPTAAERGADHRERMAARSREQSDAVAEIGDIPAVVNPERKEACRHDLKRFLQEYFPESTGLSPFSPDHDGVIDRIQLAIVGGGRAANAVYRGFAKTTITENASLWAALYGYRRYLAVFAATKDLSKESIDSIKQELETNELLAGDFPEVCHAVEALEGKFQRCNSQLQNGRLTYISWTAEKIVFPTIYMDPEEAKAKGIDVDEKGICRNSGTIITARVFGARGLKHKRPDGTQQRPDFVFLDDIQTDDEARNPNAVTKNLRILKKTVLRLGGHRKTLSVVMNGTVIERNDLMDQVLVDPAWQRVKIPMLKKWADAHQSFWLRDYADVRRSFDPEDKDDKARAKRESTELYRSRRLEADAGCVVSWESCFDDDEEISAIQHAYNILVDDGHEAFASECQQEPVRPEEDDVEQLTDKVILAKKTRLVRGRVPLACDKLTAFIDVQGKLLYWIVCAWGDGFQGSIIDYGSFPDQGRISFTLRDATRTLQHVFRGAGLEGAIYAGLDGLTSEILGRDWKREDGTLLRISRCLVDSGWGESTETVHTFCRQSRFAGILVASKGEGITAAKVPMSEHQKKPGETLGMHAIIGAAGKGRRLLRFDTNWWKSFVCSRFLTSMGDRGSLTLFGHDADAHDMLISHLLAEYRVKTEGRGRTVDAWSQRPGRADNHWWDCIVGCAVGAAFEGITLTGHPRAGGPDRRKASLPTHLMRR